MHPILFQFETPDFLTGIFPSTISIYSYGFMIAMGIFMAYFYTAFHAKKQFGWPYDKTQMMIVLIIIAAVVGGKVFIAFEDPAKYFGDPAQLFENFGSGFVFYGSLIFAIPTVYFYIKYYKVPALPMLDIIAGTTCVVHAFGRMGCFFGGCCYGVPTDSFVGMSFEAGIGIADHLHPTQLYSVILISSIFMYLMYVKKRQEFDGQLFLTYLILYSIGRSVIEVFRGDEERGYVIDGILTNSQFISLLIFSTALYFYIKLKKRAYINQNN